MQPLADPIDRVLGNAREDSEYYYAARDEILHQIGAVVQ